MGESSASDVSLRGGGGESKKVYMLDFKTSVNILKGIQLSRTCPIWGCICGSYWIYLKANRFVFVVGLGRREFAEYHMPLLVTAVT